VVFSLTIIAFLYGSVMWLVSKDEICGRPFWILSYSAMVMVCLLQGRPDVSPVFGTAMILGGGLLSLFTTRQVRLLFIPLIGFICLTGIIFTPSSAGWSGIWIIPFQLSNVIFLVGHSLLLSGFLKHTFRQDETQEDIDRWVQIIYPAGLIILAITFILVGFWAIDLYGVQTFWIGPTLSVALALFWLGLRSWLSREKPLQSLIISIGKAIGSVIGFIVDLKWFYRIAEVIYLLLRQFIFWLTGILEGDGGVLWALLVLLLLITLIQPEMMP
jgi:hypothetical protein